MPRIKAHPGPTGNPATKPLGTPNGLPGPRAARPPGLWPGPASPVGVTAAVRSARRSQAPGSE